MLTDRGERGPQIADKRRTVNGILWVLRHRCAVAKRYGSWNSVFVRFSRWSKLGVWDAAFETVASLGSPADQEHAIDSTIVRAHQHAVGVEGGIKIRKRLAARAVAFRPKSTCEAHDVNGYALTELCDLRPDKQPGDKGYDSDEIRNDLAARGIKPVYAHTR